MAVGAAAVLALPGFSPETDAGIPPRAVKGNRLDLRSIAKGCTRQAWRYDEANCLHDRAQVPGQAKLVRPVTTNPIAAQSSSSVPPCQS